MKASSSLTAIELRKVIPFRIPAPARKDSAFRSAMAISVLRYLSTLLLLLTFTAYSQTPEYVEVGGQKIRNRMATGEKGIVVSVNPLATKAGLDVLQKGGNAIDAAVAVGLTLGVVDMDNSGIGGGCFILIKRANGSYIAIDGRETAPAKATRDMFIRNGKADPNLSQTGPLAIGVPGA